MEPIIPSPSLLRRMAAIFYDSLLLVALWLAATALLLAVTGGQLAATDRSIWLLLALRVLLILVTIGFFTYFWVHGGQTLGMRAWRIQLVSQSGRPVTLPQALVRCAAALVSVTALGLGFLWILWDPQHRAWHDYWSGTRLVLLPRH